MTRVLVFLCGVLFTVSIRADTPSKEQQLMIDPSISHIITVGEWSQGEETGFYRFVTKSYGSNPAWSQLFVQWMVPAIDSTSQATVAAEVSVTEMNDGNYLFGSPRCKGDWTCHYFELHTIDSLTKEKYQFTLTLVDLGSYILTEQY